jgi:hypothetical protein
MSTSWPRYVPGDALVAVRGAIIRRPCIQEDVLGFVERSHSLGYGDAWNLAPTIEHDEPFSAYLMDVREMYGACLRCAHYPEARRLQDELSAFLARSPAIGPKEAWRVAAELERRVCRLITLDIEAITCTEALFQRITARRKGK